MRVISYVQPRRVVFGNGCAATCLEDTLQLGLRRVFLVTGPPIRPLVEPLVEGLKKGGVAVAVHDRVSTEPTITMLDEALQEAREWQPDLVIGFGGGSSMDVAKLVAALPGSGQRVEEVLGIGLLASRKTHLILLPTTAGTGSEVSPIAIVLDEPAKLKKGVVSPHLVADAAYVDPLLTVSVPPDVTAATGMDALTHCIEEYANRFAHPVIDLYALQGVRLIAANLLRAVQKGDDEEARARVALGSFYGGLGLGSVNTGAVHALAYPLGGEFHVAHGVSNALLLPHVIERCLPAAPQRYAEIAQAMGVEPGDAATETAQRGVARIWELSKQCGIPSHMSDLGVPREAIPRMTEAAMTVTRLLKNSPYQITADDAKAIYEAAF